MKSFSKMFEAVPDDPFYQPRKPLWLPPEMSCAPALPGRYRDASHCREPHCW